MASVEKKRILLLERPNDTTINEQQGNTGLSGFSMTVTRQGVKFAHQGSPKAVAFIDVGRVIKVYNRENDSILAALRLAQTLKASGAVYRSTARTIINAVARIWR
jgi:hypothetical protein